MRNFINKDFLLTCDAARELYHRSAEDKPIIDYHCHLSPAMIAGDHKFANITEIWLGGDHYKWRAMRANGVDEQYITGDRPDREKFARWAETVPYTMRNPLYHWTHLELSRIFGIDRILNPDSAEKIWTECNARLLTPQFSARSLMTRSRVEAVCTTDDPVDSLEYHRQIAAKPFGVKVLPTWRADKALGVENPVAYKLYIEKLEAAAGMPVKSYEDLIAALKVRHDFFAANGCKLSDHGLETFYAEDYTESDLMQIFSHVTGGSVPTAQQVLIFRSGLLHDLAVMDCEKGWTQQFHIGAIRNNFTAMFERLGPDTGYDAIHDLPCAAAGHRFFDRLASRNELAKTILYNLNPKDNEVLATMACTFNDGSAAGKMQLGSGWWFLDQEDGIRKQINALSALGLLSRFVGMLTDSRSFLSYPRHEYFRRILCDILGRDVESGRLPASEMPFIHKMVADISYNNAKQYFEF